MNEHLNFCNVCKHRQRNTRFGIVCGLNESIPTFVDKCINYQYDKDVFEKLVIDQKEFYNKILGRKLNFSNNHLDIRITRRQLNNSIQNISQLPPSIDIYSSKLINGILGIIGIGASIFIGSKIELVIENWFRAVIPIAMFLGGCFFLYQSSGVKIPILTLNDEGIIYKKKLIEWSNIVLISFQKEWKEDDSRNSVTNLVIDTLIGKEKIQVGLWNVEEPELGHYLELFKEKHKRQK
ncbi:hypothetical protein L3049_04815 [Labilibaculum sp. DW002]|uniref:Uncharacterized protein n=1 Tax=Paralabilibaculum antarcticum TaxID=2912572 RepID=A0ABT5VPH1_9BACT|nr:hypothetical protein [Labilibaculum sp. DW002]MDE5417323.1 hypothetical protein [Labilibaculum sp. DW002]